VVLPNLVFGNRSLSVRAIAVAVAEFGRNQPGDWRCPATERLWGRSEGKAMANVSAVSDAVLRLQFRGAHQGAGLRAHLPDPNSDPGNVVMRLRRLHRADVFVKKICEGQTRNQRRLAG